MVSLKKIIGEIIKNKPEFEKVLIDSNLVELKSSILIMVNDMEISVLNGLETMIKDGDKLTFIPVTHGG